MLRLRMASLALASGLLLTLSGCCSTCDEGRPFARLFNTSSYRATSMQPECECQQGQMPQMFMEGAQGPLLTAPGIAGQATPIPTIRDVPASQPPSFKIQQATPTPYIPSN